jgi:hypothetical protein
MKKPFKGLLERAQKKAENACFALKVAFAKWKNIPAPASPEQFRQAQNHDVAQGPVALPRKKTAKKKPPRKKGASKIVARNKQDTDILQRVAPHAMDDLLRGKILEEKTAVVAKAIGAHYTTVYRFRNGGKISEPFKDKLMARYGVKYADT